MTRNRSWDLVGKDYALEITFPHICNSKFIRLGWILVTCQFIGDHSPQFEIEIVLFQLHILTVAFYNRHHRDEQGNILDQEMDDDLESNLFTIEKNLVGKSLIKKPVERYMKKMINNLVMIRPCDPKYEGKTYIGFYIGDIPLELAAKDINDFEFTFFNPAIFVPELGEIILGIESWWNPVKDINQLADITTEDIENSIMQILHLFAGSATHGKKEGGSNSEVAKDGEGD